MFGTVANKKKSLRELTKVIYASLENSEISHTPYGIEYDDKVEKFVCSVQGYIETLLPKKNKNLSRWISLKILDENHSINEALKLNLGIDINNDSNIQEKLLKIKSELNEEGLDLSSLRDSIVSSIINKAEDIRSKTCIFLSSKYDVKTRKIDKVLTSKKFGIPIMLLFFALIFWITIVGANYPSELLSAFFSNIQDKLLTFLEWLNLPEFLINLLVYRNVSDCYMGCCCNATAYGNILPFIYFTRRPWVPSKNSF